MLMIFIEKSQIFALCLENAESCFWVSVSSSYFYLVLSLSLSPILKDTQTRQLRKDAQRLQNCGLRSLALRSAKDSAPERPRRGTRGRVCGRRGGEARGANLTGLVLGCIEAKFCNKICVWKLSPRSTQCTPLHSSVISFFVKICQIFCKICKILTNFDKKMRLRSRAKECIV